MEIITAGIRRKSMLTNPGGSSNVPCWICKDKALDRIRILTKDGVKNLCLRRDCWRLAFGVLPIVASGIPKFAGKVTATGCKGRIVNCRCGKIPVGGVWCASENPKIFPTWIVALCVDCLVESIAVNTNAQVDKSI